MGFLSVRPLRYGILSKQIHTASNSSELFYYMKETSFHLWNSISIPKFRGWHPQWGC